ncbi:MAG: D-sedoheptulose 7-phosphate isomerase [Candidatus Micrarchaeota archaeon]|nr:D-sedoheptulose 7-phosphate isomerase [Candidatus Micrarchaeota archaeon]
MDTVKSSFEEHLSVLARAGKENASQAAAAAQKITDCLKKGGKILICGNGGSAADSQHFAAELSGRYKKDRRALAAVSLTTDTSALTAIGNDYGFERIFARQVEALGKKGDMLVALSTSGNSPNILAAIEAAKKAGMVIIGFSGETGGKMTAACDLCICVPSSNTPRIQEAHITIIHIICEIVENEFAR